MNVFVLLGNEKKWILKEMQKIQKAIMKLMN